MSFEPGFRFGPYEIVSRLGAGGMGEVYRARDLKLHRDVALKVLPQDSPAGMERLRRFEQEARAASQLNHPNIVTIYDIGEVHGVTYIAMELVDGRNLRDLTADRELPLRQIVRIAAKVAEGLSAAHERGITHRDLKPENVMVTSEGFIKILDFGLAKLTLAVNEVDATIPQTTPGAVFGTVNYMAPEQASGEVADFRADQFSLGVILYEMVARKRPFDRTTAVETMTAIIRDDAPPLSAIRNDIPPRLLRIIQRCLAKEAGERYASTRDLARDLREVRDELSGEPHSGGRSSPELPRPPRFSRRLLLIAAAALVVLAGGAALWVQRGRPAPTGEVRRALFVMPLRDATGGRAGQVFSDGLTETISARLAQSPGIQVVRPVETNPTDALKSARRYGADMVLQGVAQRTNDHLRISYSIVDTTTSSQIGGDSLTGSTSDLFALQDLVAQSVLRVVGAPAPAQRAAAGGLDRAADQESYVTALGLMHRLKDEAALDEAIRRLEALLLNARDSALVNGALGKALLMKYALTKKGALIDQASVYAARAAEIDPSRADVHVTLGELKKTGGMLPEAAAEFQKALALHPDLPDAALGQAETSELMGKGADAERQYQRVLVLTPDWPSAYAKYGRFCYSRGRYDKAVELFGTMTRLLPDSPRGYNNLGAALMALGRYDQALQAYRRSLAMSPSASTYSNLGTCEYTLGRFAEAAVSFEKASTMTPDNYIVWMNLGDARRWSPGDRQRATAAYEQAIHHGRAALAVNPKDAVAHAVIASSLAKMGREAEAAKEIDLALKLDPTDQNVLYQSAVVTLLRRDREGASAWLQRATAAGYSQHAASRDPELAELVHQ